MLKPHLLLTVLVFALVAWLAVHYGTQRSGSWPTGSKTSTSDVGAGSSGNGDGNGNGGNDGWSQSGNGYSSGDGYRRSYGRGSDRNVAGQFDYYALVLSWSPSYCAENADRNEQQCDRRDGRRYSFVLHGLWPQYNRGYPSACHLPRRPFVPDDVIARMLDIMPSRSLVIHEYRTHGTCSGLDPAQYFSTALRLFNSIVIPPRFQSPSQAQYATPSEIRSAFLRANPSLGPEMLAVVCNGNGLKEIRICFAKDGHPRACGANENQNKLCSRDRVFIPPSGATARQAAPIRQTPPDPAPTANQQSPLPGPRMDYDYGRHNR
jgi:ribonuclease T2